MNRRPCRSPVAGFTLTQLLVTIAIVAILATVGYPSYRAQIIQVRRADMQSELLALAQMFERKHAESGCFNAGPDNDCSTNGEGEAGAPAFTFASDFYDIEVTDLGVDTFTIIATPKGSQDGDGALYIDQAQQRSWDENDDEDADDPGEDDWHRG